MFWYSYFASCMISSTSKTWLGYPFNTALIIAFPTCDSYSVFAEINGAIRGPIIL
jgi:hypothetical protein